MPTVDSTIVNDAVEDAILDYLRRPDRYNPARSRLDTFIALAAKRDVLNALACDRRRQTREAAIASLQSPNTNLKNWSTLDKSDVSWTAVWELLTSNPERLFFLARLDGERRTGPLAQILGLHTSPPEEQRRAVKRMTDKLRNRLRRSAVGDRHEKSSR
jgi:hypothetical protein